MLQDPVKLGGGAQIRNPDDFCDFLGRGQIFFAWKSGRDGPQNALRPEQESGRGRIANQVASSWIRTELWLLRTLVEWKDWMV